MSFLVPVTFMWMPRLVKESFIQMAPEIKPKMNVAKTICGVSRNKVAHNKKNEENRDWPIKNWVATTAAFKSDPSKLNELIFSSLKINIPKEVLQVT